ncbi:type I polyketide synthase [Streptantibioticus cattleyicolor]|uniref:Putative type I polyketide synthase n=1 Tax=Streptantibioticus cattleyicolor (strain ATCC 35852 / DSM 46488 / JCM 4925 / NBRC 14057 / NRRL 8057) TaxID=1003195 RepID=F8JLU9_STREN|nr:type I polyketide synthase [Streptantibioticus cattleyicolor]AEW98243.1 putative type I polyketide synthase [Streptantibioticus cattleyicolor NRRL 8057 = DSM 46488]CCB72693.1 putative type I polyketide synthase [Streptantibioticus cattleyicolor NRRL 8057 = DSM 46488]
MSPASTPRTSASPPKEASRIDPQQRLLLECAVEALDDAALDINALAGSETAVITGVSNHDYADLQARRVRSTNPYTTTGGYLSITANRVSYELDLTGPSSAVDTACSSGLTALHQACEHLRTGHSPLALAGAVNVMLSPAPFVGFAQAGVVSPTGRCHPFGAAADGFVRSEGAVMLVLKPLAAALADGDRVHGVILATGVNSDGRTVGLSAPSSRTQAALLRRVYAAAGIDPRDVSYVEAHGTGTLAGDPVECAALGEVLGSSRADAPLPVGSVKSNLGHLQAVGGMAGVLKSLVVIESRSIPRTLHADPPNPKIDFDRLGLRPVLTARPVPGTSRVVVGVNSFGIGSANAHAVLAAPPVRSTPPARADVAVAPVRPVPVVVSAHTPQALTAALESWAEHFTALAADSSQGPEALYDAAFTSCRRRTRRRHGTAFFATDLTQAAEVLTRAARGQEGGTTTERRVNGGRIGFVFCGNGSQWAGMGAQLLGQDRAFTADVEAVSDELEPLLGWNVREELAHADASRWDRTEVAQPMLFAVQAGLVAALSARGVDPHAVMGHSVGEVAAAYCAGGLTRAQACRVIAARSLAQAATVGSGGMAAVGLGEDAARERLQRARLDDRVEISAINSDQDVTLAGPHQDLAALGAALDADGVFFRDLRLDYAFHTQAMDPVRDQRTRALKSLVPGSCRIPLISTVTGRAESADALDAEYWWANIRRPVRFHQAATELTTGDAACDVLVEIGPHPVLTAYLRRTTAGAPAPGVIVPTLSRTFATVDALRQTVLRVLAAGAAADWDRYFPRPGAVADLPTVAWQRERHWNGDPSWWREDAPGEDTADAHPLLGSRQAGPEAAWLNRLDADRLSWMEDHRVADAVVWPAAGFVEMALAAGRSRHDEPLEITGLSIGRALTLDWSADPASPTDGDDIHLATHLAQDGRLTIRSRTGEQDWTEHVRAGVRSLLRPQRPRLDITALKRRLPNQRPAIEHYAAAHRAGLDYGPAFRTVTHLHTGPDEALGRYEFTAPVQPEPAVIAHPTLLDGALQSCLPLVFTADRPAPFLPARITTVRGWQPLPSSGFVHVTRATGPDALWDIAVCNDHGAVCMELLGCELRRFDTATADEQDRLTVVLRAAPLPGQPEPGRSPLPAPRTLPELVRQRNDAHLGRLHRISDALLPRLLEVCSHFTAQAMRHLLPAAKHSSFGLADLVDAGVQAKHAKLLDVLLPQAAGHGALTATGPGAWSITATPRAEELFSRLLEDFPGQSVTVLTYGECAGRLADVLTGDANPLELLFAESDNLVQRFYEASTFVAPHTHALVGWIRDVVDGWPADRPLRILEVGAGTGATTAALLPHLPPERVHYTFTDVSPAFFPAAKKRFHTYDFLTHQVLDAGGDPVAQGFEPGAYDLVIAANILHATSDITRALRAMATLLADGGHLIALETHSVELLAPVFGLLDSFWLPTDEDVRPDGPLVPYDRWPELLADCGFPSTAHYDDTAADRPYVSLIVAERGAHAVPDKATDRTSPAPTALDDAAQRSWLLSTPTADAPTELAHRLTRALLTARPHDRVHHVARASGADPWARELTGAADGSEAPRPVSDVILLAEPAGETAPRQHTDHGVRQLAALRDLARAWSRSERSREGSLRVWIIDADSQQPPTPPPSPHGAPLWGAARSLANEDPSLNIRRVALTEPGNDDTVKRLLHELRHLQGNPEDVVDDEVVLTPHGRFATRVTPLPATEATCEPGPHYALHIDATGRHPVFTWRATTALHPAEGEVVIRTAAAALNHHDLLTATGNGSPPAARRHGFLGLGLDCAGTVTAVGPGVTRLAPGDRVAAMAHTALASHVLASSDHVIPLPDTMEFTAAATLPTAFLTAHHALQQCAALTEDDTVLVHAAAGGVGLAAVHLAQRAGARVIATAGTPAKRSLLRLLGVEHVLDSRTLDFAEQVADLTDGRGVDVVLNSLPGEARLRGLHLLAPQGRFIELARRDAERDAPLPVSPPARNVSFFAVDTLDLHDRRTPLVRRHFTELAEAVTTGHVRPVPHHTFPAHRFGEAFGLLNHARHIGRVVISFDAPPPVADDKPASALDADAAYVIIGGLAAFGAATARHLAARGARHLHLVGRRGARTPGAEELLDELRAATVEVTVDRADITRPGALDPVRTALRERRLGGVVHAAMVLADAPLTDCADTHLETVLAPKITGLHALAALAEDHDPDFFLAYSSVAALAGNIQQAPYAAANAAMEALIRARHRCGSPALAVQWGVIADAGYVHRTGRIDEMASYGMAPVTATDALTALDRLLDTRTGPSSHWAASTGTASAASCPASRPPGPAHCSNSVR